MNGKSHTRHARAIDTDADRATGTQGATFEDTGSQHDDYGHYEDYPDDYP